MHNPAPGGLVEVSHKKRRKMSEQPGQMLVQTSLWEVTHTDLSGFSYCRCSTVASV